LPYFDFRQVGKNTFFLSTLTLRGCLTSLLTVFLLLVLVVAIVRKTVHWAGDVWRDYPVVPVSVAIAIGVGGFYAYRARRAQRQFEEVARLEPLVADLRKAVQQAIEIKDPNARRTGAQRVLEALTRAEQVPRFNASFQGLASTKVLLVALERGATVADQLSKAAKCRFMGKAEGERDYLSSALFEIRESGVTDEDLAILTKVGVDPQYSTVQQIESRARELGWHGEPVRKNES